MTSPTDSIIPTDPRGAIRASVEVALDIRNERRGLALAIQKAAQYVAQDGSRSTNAWEDMVSEQEVRAAREWLRGMAPRIVELIATLDADARETVIRDLLGAGS